jgi:AraC family transcriptional regulator of arabinose operon
LYAPPHAQWYRAVDDMFGHDWFHCAGEDVAGLVRQYRIPVNRVFYPQRTDFITPIVSEITHEIALDGMYRHDMNGLHAVRLFIHLSRELHRRADRTLTPHKAALIDAFEELRLDIHHDPTAEWNLTGMARRVGLSKSRFSALYKEFFDIPPIEDVITSRLRKACYLLSNSSMAVKEIADECGFGNIYYFSRLFKKRLNCNASSYYRRTLTRPRPHAARATRAEA